MQKKFVELVTGFLAEAGLDLPVVPGENIVAVPVGDISFHIGLFENRKAIVFQGIVGILPGAGREAFCLELLRMNSFFMGTKGGTLAIEDDAVTLQTSVAISSGDEELSQTAFNAQAIAFLDAFAAVMEDFGGIAERAARAGAPAGLDPTDMAGMLRI